MDEHKMYVDSTTSSRGAQWAGAGSLIAIAAQQLLGGNGLGGLFCGGGNVSAVNALMAENAQLKADAATDKKLADVYSKLRDQDKAQDAVVAGLFKEIYALDKRVGEVAMCANQGISALNGSVASLQATVAGITKCVVPLTAICPQPMPQFNSWVAPTTTEAAGSQTP